MNQILSTSNDNNYNTSDTKKIVIIFCIAIILIACVIIAVAIFSKNKNKGEFISPDIEISRQNETDISIKVACADGINFVSYTWNDEKNNRVNLNGSTNFERIVNIPENSNNILKIEAVSSKGTKGTKQEQFERDIDSSKPTIDEMSVVGSSLHIEASDDNEIDYMAYQWEDEEERIIKPDEEVNKTITADINIKRGTYKLTLKIFDKSGNKAEISKLITGVNQPEINVIKYGDIVRVTITHDMGFKRIEYIINDNLYIYDENYSGYDKDKTMMELDFPLNEGENIVKVKAYSLEKLSDDETDDLANYSYKTFVGRCTYIPEQ